MPQTAHGMVEKVFPAARKHEESPLSEMLAQEPSRLTRRFLYGLLIALGAAVVVASVLRVDVTVSAPALLIPEGKALPIQPEIAGTVVEVRVQEGASVARGDVLAVLESEKAGEQLLALREAALKWQTAQSALEVLLPVELKKIDTEIAALREEEAHRAREQTHLKRKREHEDRAFRLLTEAHAEQLHKLAELEKRLATDEQISSQAYTNRLKVLEAETNLFRKQAISEVEYMEVRRQAGEALGNLVKVRSQQREARNDRALAEKNYLRDVEGHRKALVEIDQELERADFQARDARGKALALESSRRLKQLEAETSTRTAKAEYELARRKAELSRGPLNRQAVEDVYQGLSPALSRILVTAPCAGRVGTVQIRRTGEAVERGQTLMTLLPDGPLVAEVRIANKDVGLIHTGQEVKLKLDAFPFAEYGSVRGVLTLVPPDAEGMDKPGESFYRATARLKQSSVQKNNSTVALVSGMTATAEVITERKTVLELLLTPLLEPFQN
jgi:membrane fusion protein, hemolysin D